MLHSLNFFHNILGKKLGKRWLLLAGGLVDHDDETPNLLQVLNLCSDEILIGFQFHDRYALVAHINDNPVD